MLRSLTTAALVLTVSACEPSLPTNPPTSAAYAVFDPSTGKIPLPNDLAFLNPPNTTCPPPANTMTGAPACAQAELLTLFAGKFPSDQEVGVTIDFTQSDVVDGKVVQVAPDLDLASFTPTTFYAYNTLLDTAVPLETPVPADYVKGTDKGTLTLHNKGRAPWPEGSYVVLVRGGASGVKTMTGAPVGASQVLYLIAQGKDMTKDENLGLLKAQGGLEAARAQGRQLAALIGIYSAPKSVFEISDTKFKVPHQELASFTTFKIGPAFTNVTIDSARGIVPLPFDLLRDAKTGKISTLAACTFASSKLGPDGKCLSPASAGFEALDGFSTTGPLLAQTSDLIAAATVTPASLQLWELPKTGAPVKVDPNSYITEPCEFTGAATQGVPCGSATVVAPVIAIQPAGVTAAEPGSVFRTRPLKDNTDYAVVITNDVKDKAGKAIAPGTVANILRFTHPISVGGKSQLSSADDATAAALEAMRLQLKPVFTALATAGTPASKVAMAYTFRTQTILSTALQLAALPYTQPAATALPLAGSLVVHPTVTAAFTKYGVDAQAVPGDEAGDSIDQILEADITTFNLLDPATGAFNPDPTKAVAETIRVLIATPEAAKVTKDCPAPAVGLKCAPMMVFRHGLGRGRVDMLALADTNAAAGIVTVAIDAAKHGDRSFCTSGPASATTGCVGGAACVTTLPAGAQGDANPPGSCGAAGFIKRPASATCATPGLCPAATDGIPLVSGNFLTSANFFRTRDSMRQDLIDQSQLIRVLAAAPPAGHVVFDHMKSRGVIIDAAEIYYSGQSLGAIQGAMNVATNPRISKAVFNVGGGTLVDVFTNAPDFRSVVNPLLMSLGINRATDPAGFLRFLAVAKTVLDPADPINFAGRITENPLPNLLVNPVVNQLPKSALVQIANCDQTVPNAFNFIYAANLKRSPLPPNGTAGTVTLFTGTGTVPLPVEGDCTGTPMEHGFLLDWRRAPAVTKVLTAQSDLAAFLKSDTLPPSIR
jgi:hypothetical protein